MCKEKDIFTNATIIVIPHDINLPCEAYINGDFIKIENEIDILTIQRKARTKRIDGLHPKNTKAFGGDK